MNFHRNSNGGYTGDSADHGLTATITKTGGALPAWLVVVENCGTEVDRAWYAKIADAKWHATAVANTMVMHPGTRHDDLYPPFDGTVSLTHPNGTGGRYR